MKKLNLFSGLRDFMILWGSQAVSSLGTAMTNFALIVWVYSQKGTASSIALLSICSLVPSVLFSFVAGTLADRWDKKRIMLIADLAAALGTLAVLVLFTAGQLQIWHLYITNFLLSFMNAFQGSASYVATTLLTPKEQYVRASGLQSLSSSAVMITAPAFGSVILAVGGLRAVLLIDLATFAIAFTVLLFFIKLPTIVTAAKNTGESFLQGCMAGIRFLREHPALLRIILFFAWINFIAKMGGYGMLPALILGRTGGDQIALGVVEAAVGFGSLAGGAVVTLMRPAKSRTVVMFVACGVSFLLGDLLWSFGRSLPLWTLSGFLCNLSLPFLNANLSAIMRTRVPVEMQGRVFSARNTLQYGTIPFGLLLGGFLADYVFEPFMAAPSPAQQVLTALFGAGKGSGVAVIFFLVGVTGCVTSFLCLRNPDYKSLD